MEGGLRSWQGAVRNYFAHNSKSVGICRALSFAMGETIVAEARQDRANRLRVHAVQPEGGQQLLHAEGLEAGREEVPAQGHEAAGQEVDNFDNVLFLVIISRTCEP